ncbi:MAG: 2-amino-4-hydroxy-6-hydroxymethyldihydropteridine diphosphokinase [Elstera sp.]
MTATEKSILIALGSNLSHSLWGNPPAILAAAVAMLEAEGVSLLRQSSIWRSAAWPDPADPSYANGVIAVETTLDPSALLALLHRIEAAFGRERGSLNAPRTLDLDLISYDNLVWAGPEAPILPHPRAHQRGFVLKPLAEIQPDWCHPVSGLSVVALLAALPPEDCHPWAANA